MITDTTPVQFLAMVRPPPWTLVAIHPVYGKGIETRTFNDATAAAGWIADWDGRWNLYLHVNRLVPGDHRDKGKRVNVDAMEFYHADADCKPTSPVTLDAKLNQILAYDPAPPSLLVMSGGGLNAWYRLRDPIPAPAGARQDGKLWRVHERVNYQLERDLNDHGDGTWDVCRILRLAGTMNVLSDKKRREDPGRKECRAELWIANDSTFTPEQFREAPEGTTRGTRPGKIDPLPDDLPTVDVEALPVGGDVKSLILVGHDLLNPDRYRSERSGAVFSAILSLLRAGVDDATILSVLLNDRYGISGHCIDYKGDSRQYAIKQIENAKGVVHHGDRN